MTKNQRAQPMNNPLILALDVDTQEQAFKIADAVSDIVGGIKLGPRLCLRYGMEFVKEMAARAPIFLDNKHFDIPSTMEAAVRASFEAGASLVTV
ncbi:MAG: orotidine 5'-phosphate decarboxylase / HUMPS family protein, partial [Bdellovibrio sp.]